MNRLLLDIQQGFEVGGGALLLLAALLWLAWLVSIYHWWSSGRIVSLACMQTSAELLASVGHRHSRCSAVVREELLSRARLALFDRLYILRLVVVLGPLCGLLGTVSGMIEVFDVVQRVGTGNVQALASGISRATFSTAAGIVVSLIALGLHTFLLRSARSRLVLYEKGLEA